MNLRKMFHLCGFLELTKGYLNDKIHCASFTTVTKLVPANARYNATLTFSVLNTCGIDVQSVKVFRGDVHQFSQPTCHVRYTNGNCDVAMGCTCNRHSQNVSVNRNVDENLKDEVWILEGELADGAMFNNTVTFNVESMPQGHFPLVTVVAGSACAAVVIAIIIFVNVCCQRKNDRASPTSRQSARGCPGRQLPQPPTPARAQDTGQQKVQPEQSRHVRPDSSHAYVDVDDYIKTTAGTEMNRLLC
ncbi:uncharacterized protein [Littorina saxatilis]|uniref:uncharacterized protein n=1 Tax=Littorina saxatilis TaxID=31220 RepID=UPI0038B5512B